MLNARIPKFDRTAALDSDEQDLARQIFATITAERIKMGGCVQANSNSDATASIQAAVAFSQAVRAHLNRPD
jgi:hypothetical protein